MNKILLIVFVSFLSAGCVPSTVALPTAPKSLGGVEVKKGIIDKNSTHQAIQINDSPFYYTQTKGGSVVWFLVGGALGSAISGALVDNKTETEAAAAGLTNQVALYNLVSDSLISLQSPKVQSASFFLEPFILLQNTKKENILISLVYVVAENSLNEAAWEENYYFHLNTTVPASVLKDDENRKEIFDQLIQNELSDAVVKLSELVVKDLQGKVDDLKEVTAQSNYFGELFNHAPFRAILLSGTDSLSPTLRVIGNSELKSAYSRGMHIFQSADDVKIKSKK